MGTIEAVGPIYQQTFIDTYSKVAFAKLYNRKHALVTTDIHDKVLPFFDDHGIRLLRVLTDREVYYCGARNRHEYELYLTLEDIDIAIPKPKSDRSPKSSNASIVPFRINFTL